MQPNLMPADGVVFISGATGVLAAYINGAYDCKLEIVGGYRHLIYYKRVDPSICIEHFQERWQIKEVACKGSNTWYASIEGGCALQACTSRPWMVWEGQEKNDVLGIKIVTGTEAQVRSHCLCT